jgi:hypothetical protein
MGNNKIFLRKTFPMTMIKKSKTKSKHSQSNEIPHLFSVLHSRDNLSSNLKKKKRISMKKKIAHDINHKNRNSIKTKAIK